MRKLLPSMPVLTGLALLCFSCTRINEVVQAEELKAKPGKKANCEALSFHSRSESVEFIQHITTFKKGVEASTGKTSRILAGRSGPGIVDSIDLTLHWRENSVAFTKTDSPQDTLLVVNLNKKGDPVSVVAGNSPDPQFPSTQFEYKAQKLTAIKVPFGGKTFSSVFSYDNKGNLVRIQDEKFGSATPGRVDYQYDLSSKAVQQVYQDAPRPFIWNTFSLLEYAGFFPSLQPTNLRTRTVVTWEDNYVVYDLKIANHQIDAGGNLVAYDVVNPTDNKRVMSHTIGWTCGSNDALVQ
jgi:hypothetical protein